jgi:hypothetical protein
MSICYRRYCTVRPLGALWRLTAVVRRVLFLTAGATQPVPDGWSTTPDRGAAALLFFFVSFDVCVSIYPFVRVFPPRTNFPESSPSSKSASRLGCFLTLVCLSIELKKNRQWHKSTTYKNKVRKIRDTKDN